MRIFLVYVCIEGRQAHAEKAFVDYEKAKKHAEQLNKESGYIKASHIDEIELE